MGPLPATSGGSQNGKSGPTPDDDRPAPHGGNTKGGQQKSHTEEQTGVRIAYVHLLYCFIFPALGGLLYGYDIGAMAMVLGSLQSKEYSETTWYDQVAASSLLLGLITSMVTVGAVLGSALILKLESPLGRRGELAVASCLYLFGSLGEYASTSIWSLSLARCLYGVGVGFAMHGAPAYIAETSPASLRGALVSGKEAMIVLGMLLGYGIGGLCRNIPGGWRLVFLVASPIALVMLVGTLTLLPRSPRWLLLKNRRDEARRALRFVLPDLSDADFADLYSSDENNNSEEETTRSSIGDDDATSDGGARRRLALLGNTSTDETKETPQPTSSYNIVCRSTTRGPSSRSAGGGLACDGDDDDDDDDDDYRSKPQPKNKTTQHIWSDPASRAGLIAGVGLVVLQQITGQPSVLYYASELFEAEGLGADASILLAAWKLGCTLCAVVAVDNFGRKTLLYAGCACMALALAALVLATAESTSSSTSSERKSAVVLGAMFLYIGGYQVGFGPVVWTLISEIFPLAARGKALAIATLTNFSLNALVTLLAAPLIAASPALAFGVFLALTLYSFFFIHAHVPETKGLELEEITAMLRRRAATTHNNTTTTTVAKTVAKKAKGRDHDRVLTTTASVDDSPAASSSSSSSSTLPSSNHIGTTPTRGGDGPFAGVLRAARETLDSYFGAARPEPSGAPLLGGDANAGPSSSATDGGSMA